MVETLAEYRRTHSPEGFSPVPQYFEDGDFVTYFVKSTLFYAVRVDPLLTVYRDEETDEIVGYKIKSVRYLLNEMKEFGYDTMERSYSNGDLQLSLLFIAAATTAQDQSSKVKYQEMAKMSRGVSIPLDQIFAQAA